MLSTLAESSYVGYNLFVILVLPLVSALVLLIVAELLGDRRFKMAVKIIAGSFFIAWLLFSYVPLQTNATGELVANEEPDSFQIDGFDYEYEQNSEIDIRATGSSVEHMKIFAENQNQPTSEAERLNSSPETTLELPKTDTIIVVSYSESGAVIEEIEIDLQESSRKSTIL